MHPNTRIILATITPKPGQADKVLDLFGGIIKYAEEHEPGSLEVQILREVNQEGVEQFFTIERFKNEEALRVHQANPGNQGFFKAVREQDLLQKEVDIKIVRSVAGFSA